MFIDSQSLSSKGKTLLTSKHCFSIKCCVDESLILCVIDEGLFCLEIGQKFGYLIKYFKFLLWAKHYVGDEAAVQLVPWLLDVWRFSGFLKVWAISFPLKITWILSTFTNMLNLSPMLSSRPNFLLTLSQDFSYCLKIKSPKCIPPAHSSALRNRLSLVLHLSLDVDDTQNSVYSTKPGNAI